MTLFQNPDSNINIFMYNLMPYLSIKQVVLLSKINDTNLYNSILSAGANIKNKPRLILGLFHRVRCNGKIVESEFVAVYDERKIARTDIKYYSNINYFDRSDYKGDYIERYGEICNNLSSSLELSPIVIGDNLDYSNSYRKWLSDRDISYISLDESEIYLAEKSTGGKFIWDEIELAKKSKGDDVIIIDDDYPFETYWKGKVVSNAIIWNKRKEYMIEDLENFTVYNIRKIGINSPESSFEPITDYYVEMHAPDPADMYPY